MYTSDSINLTTNSVYLDQYVINEQWNLISIQLLIINNINNYKLNAFE